MRIDSVLIRRVTAIHYETIKRILSYDELHPLELAEFFEDVGNRFIDFSEEMSATYLTAQKSKLKEDLESLAAAKHQT